MNLLENSLAGSAMASHVVGRDFRFINTTNDLISFNLTGVFDAELSASIEGTAGSVRTSCGFGLEFDVGQGAIVNYFPITPYFSTTTETDLGAFVSDLF